MSMTKAIQYGKEHRKPYVGCKAIAKSCRNHGDCPYCYMNRMHKYIKRTNQMKEEMKDFERGIL